MFATRPGRIGVCCSLSCSHDGTGTISLLSVGTDSLLDVREGGHTNILHIYIIFVYG